MSILLAAFAPSLVHALSTGSNASAFGAEICSTASPDMSKADRSSAGAMSSHLDHCPYCYTHGGMSGLPAIGSFVLPALPPALSHPALYYQSPRPLFIWASARSRAPPSRS